MVTAEKLTNNTSKAVEPTVHIPVMLQQVVAAMAPEGKAVIVDATFGGGGYTRALLAAGAQRVIAIDRDASAVARAAALIQEWGPQRLSCYHARFAELESVLAQANCPQVDGIVFDLGLSSDQLADKDRGFAFSLAGELNMGMGLNQLTAADIVNNYSAEEIADILWHYGDERHSRRLARYIVAARPITSTEQLAAVVASAMPDASRKSYKHHPATRTFQALRIAVNDELNQLVTALHSTLKLLKPGGQLVVVSFHSLEDRLVKDFLRQHSAEFEVEHKKGLMATPEEVATNPRSRSARLRSAKRIIS